MTKYILTTRSFRDEFIRQAKEIAPEYQFFSKEDITDSFDWQKVVITIGWQKEWEEKLLFPKTSLKWIQSISAGVDTLPLKKLDEYNILLSNASGIHAQSITDHLLAVLFMKTRGLFEAIEQQQKKNWYTSENFCNLEDLRILIVGTGRIGQRLAKSLSFFGCHPIGINTNGRKIDYFDETHSLVELAHQTQKADVVINILPLTEDTHHLFDEEFFNLMKPSGTFINVGRGASVDTEAIYQALKNQTIAFAALDVFEEEPLPEDHPLWDLTNILITPHISGYTPHFQRAFMPIFLENLANFNEKNTLVRNMVNVKTGY